MRAAAAVQPDLLDKLGLTPGVPARIVGPDGTVFDRWPLHFIEPRHESLYALALDLGDIPPVSGAIASWPAWFAAAWLHVRRLLKHREAVARG